MSQFPASRHVLYHSVVKVAKWTLWCTSDTDSSPYAFSNVTMAVWHVSRGAPSHIVHCRNRLEERLPQESWPKISPHLAQGALCQGPDQAQAQASHGCAPRQTRCLTHLMLTDKFGVEPAAWLHRTRVVASCAQPLTLHHSKSSPGRFLAAVNAAPEYAYRSTISVRPARSAASMASLHGRSMGLEADGFISGVCDV